MTISCIIVDDEPLPAELLQDYIVQIPFLKLLGTFNNALDADRYLKQARVDLLFLDIQMPHVNGIQLLKTLQHKPMVIFTTAYHQYAVEGFELDAIDYLLKPIDFERFLKAATKARDHQRFVHLPQSDVQPYIFVRADYQMIKINIADIQFIEGWDDYIKIYVGNKMILTLMSLRALLELLPPEGFMRVHRSYIVPIDKVESIGNKVIKIGSKEIPVGTTYVEAVNEWLKRK